MCLSKFIRSVWTWLVGLVGKNNIFQGLEMSTLSELLIASIQVVLEFVFEYILNILFYLEKARDSLFCFLMDNNFFPTVLGLCCCLDDSLVAMSRGYYLVMVCRPLIVVASLVVEHRL